MTTLIYAGMPTTHLDETESTNTYLKQALKEQALPMPCAVYADRQTGGRGRMGRQFVSPEGGLYVSVLLPARSPEDASRMTPLCAVAVCRALEEEGIDAQIKWVNDVYVQSKKVCGVLCEGVDGGVICGMGVNLKTPEGGFPPEAGPAGSANVTCDKETFLEKSLQQLLAAVQNPHDALEYYRAKMLYLNRQVMCQVGNKTVSGRVLGVDDEFGLVLENGEGRKVTVRSGEVTKVRAARGAAFFDFDGTMRRGDSIVPYVKFMRKKGVMPLKQYIKTLICAAGFVMKMLPSRVAKTAALAFRKNLSAEEAEKLDKEFAQEIFKDVYKDALTQWEKCRAEGLHMVVLSASTENYMKYMAQLLHADHLMCTRIEQDGSVDANCHGPEKAVRAIIFAREHGIDLEMSCAYGDSGSDRYILEITGNPVPVNPKRKLKKFAKQKGWEAKTWA